MRSSHCEQDYKNDGRKQTHVRNQLIDNKHPYDTYNPIYNGFFHIGYEAFFCQISIHKFYLVDNGWNRMPQYKINSKT